LDFSFFSIGSLHPQSENQKLRKLHSFSFSSSSSLCLDSWLWEGREWNDGNHLGFFSLILSFPFSLMDSFFIFSLGRALRSNIGGYSIG
jgi:hypothetical protein